MDYLPAGAMQGLIDWRKHMSLIMNVSLKVFPLWLHQKWCFVCVLINSVLSSFLALTPSYIIVFVEQLSSCDILEDLHTDLSL